VVNGATFPACCRSHRFTTSTCHQICVALPGAMESSRIYSLAS
jgi:hypothetical protein